MFNRIKQEIIAFYGKGTFDQFFDRFKKAGFDFLVELPLLAEPFNEYRAVQKTHDINFTSLQALRIKNLAKEQVALRIFFNISGARSIDELFKRFVAVTSHAVREAHFRDYPEYYAKVLSGNRFFAFHGNGFCTMLALLMQGLAKQVLNMSIDAMYCSSSDGMMSHGYCLYDQNSQKIYLDPDLKCHFSFSDFNNIEPATWFLNLIENIAIRKFVSFAPEVKASFFTKRTQEYFKWLETCCTRELSMPGSRYDITNDLLKKTLKDNSEVLDINLDDYPWKAQYREEAKKIKAGTENYFMQCLDEPVEFLLASDDELSLNNVEPNLKEEIDFYRFIFFGRTALRLSFRVADNNARAIKLPDLPWMISSNQPIIYLNRKKLSLRQKNEGLFYAAAGEIEEVLGDYLEILDLSIEAPSQSICNIYFPANASFWNSEWISLDSAGKLEIKQATL